MKSEGSLRYFVLIVLPAVLWLFFNTTVNKHIHVLSNGFVISHFHPVVDKQAESNPLNPHKHTKKELLLLSIFSSLVFSILSFLAVRPFLNVCHSWLRIRIAHQEPGRKYFQVYHYHAPPVSV
jgi:hypothetical protein